MLIERNTSEMNHKEEQRSDKPPSTREARLKSAPPYCRRARLCCSSSKGTWPGRDTKHDRALGFWVGQVAHVVWPHKFLGCMPCTETRLCLLRPYTINQLFGLLKGDFSFFQGRSLLLGSLESKLNLAYLCKSLLGRSY